MILDRLDNWTLYFPNGSLIAKAFGFLQNDIGPSTPDGRIDIDSDRLYAVIAAYETRPMEHCRFEVHRRYLDIQYLLAGSELIGWSGREGLTISEKYDPEKDVEYFEHPANYTSLQLHSGQFAFFYPDDAHAPGARLGSIVTARKVLVKIAVD